MGIFDFARRLIGGNSTGLGYAGAESSNKRKTAPIESGTEDDVLKRQKRRQLIHNTRDLRRNFSLAAWVIRKHLDYIAGFSFNVQTDDEKFNEAVERKVRQWARPSQCDASGRFGLRRMLRMLEAKAVLDGDCGFLKLAPKRNGLFLPRLQGIEGDRILNPEDVKTNGSAKWVHGILVGDSYRHLSYSIHKRTGGRQTEPERVVSANRMIWHNGYVENFDQVRGVSPLAPGLNSLRDVYESVDYSLARMKISQLFAFAITRKMNETDEDDETGYGSATNSATGTAFEDETAEDQEPLAEYDVDFGKGNVLLDMKPGHDAKFLESNQPSDQFREFMLATIQLTLKTLDIPYSFYSEDFTNFFGSRAALQHYERSCQDRRETLQEILRQITVWLLAVWVTNGEIELPRGMTLEDIAWEWVPDGVPWWDPAKEIRGDVMAIGAGLDTPQRICKERGRGDYYENVRQIAKAKKFAAEHGVDVSFIPTETSAVPDANENSEVKNDG